MKSDRAGSSSGLKRPAISKSANPVSRKKRRLDGENGDDDKEDMSIEALEDQITKSRKHYNNVAVLLQRARNQDEHTSDAHLALCRVFCRLMSEGSLDMSKTESELIISKYLNARLSEFWDLLLVDLCCPSPETQRQCLRLLMQLLKEEINSPKTSRAVAEGRLFELLNRLISSGTDRELRIYYVQAFAKHSDISALTFKSTVTLIKQIEAQDRIGILIDFMQQLAETDLDGTWTNSLKYGRSTTKYQAEAWLTLLGTSLTKQHRKVLLELIPTKIAPTLQRPERLLDFVTDAFNLGGSTALVALSSLFELMQSQNLDYGDFYSKVYSMLDSSILHSKHRSAFLRLLDTFLASTHLPATLVSSYLKRLSRLCLWAPPSAIPVIVVFAYNLLKTHPSCTFMVQRNTCCEAHAPKVDDDPFNMDEADPMESNALESSLFELYTLQSHYNPNVAVICRIMSEQFTKPAFNVEDFLDHSYASMLEADLGKVMKTEPVVEHMIPKTVFPPDRGEPDPDKNSPLSVWTFNC